MTCCFLAKLRQFELFFFARTAKAQLYKEEGNAEYRKKEFRNAASFYTEGIDVKCKDDQLNAILYTNRATSYFYLGELT